VYYLIKKKGFNNMAYCCNFLLPKLSNAIKKVYVRFARQNAELAKPLRKLSTCKK